MAKEKKKTRTLRGAYPNSLMFPAFFLYLLLFFLPTIVSLFFSLTRWSLQDWEYVGLDNFIMYFKEQELSIGFRNTLIYAVVTSGLKVIIGLYLANFLTSRLRSKDFLRSVIFFPTLVSTIGVGFTFSVLMDPFEGAINRAIVAAAGNFGWVTDGPGWLTDANLLPLMSVAMVDVWKGVGFATLIYIAGMATIGKEYYEASAVDGASRRRQFWSITVPLIRPAMFSVILLSFIGGLRSFDLIWAMTNGGPGFISDVIASINYKQYQAGFYGLATAGNVILFIMVTALVLPLSRFLSKREVAA